MTKIIELDLKQPEIACGERHQLVMLAWQNLKPGSSFRFETDHDPAPLLDQLRAQKDAALQIEYETKGPEIFRILITRKPARSACCG